MSEEKTLIVVGAGASSEAGLPTGQKLKSEISGLLRIKIEFGNLMSGDRLIAEALRYHVKQEAPLNLDPAACFDRLIEAANRTSMAMPLSISIDNFIDAHNKHKEIELCGKLAIARAILAAERQSALSNNSGFDAVSDTWYCALFRLLTEGCRIEDIEERLSRFAFVIFNYDRCVEHFLFYSLIGYYGITGEESAKLVKNMEIYHPYGTVGQLPWLEENRRGIPFGHEPSPLELLGIAPRLKTFTEGTDPGASDVSSIRSLVLSAETVIFLGFAYHSMNLDLLRTEGVGISQRLQASWYGTAMGLSSSDRDIIKSELWRLGHLLHGNVHLRADLDCTKLFQEYSRSLSVSKH